MTPKSRMFVKKLNRISFVDAGACGGLPGQGGADIAIMKRRDDTETEDQGGPMDPKKTEKAVDLDKLDADALKRVASEATEKAAALEAEVTALKASAEKRAKGDDQGDEGDLDLTDETAFKRACKGQPENVVRVLTATRKQALDAKTQAEAATKRSEEAEKRYTEERDARELETLTTKARKDMGGLTIKAEDLGNLLVAAKRAMPDRYEEMERVLRAASEQALKGRFTRSIGDDNLDEDGEATATDTVLKRAAKLIAEKKSENIGDAMSQVFAEDPQLREQYERESAVRS